MLKVGLIGIGFMGRVHLDTYIRLESEGFPLKLTSICDVDEKKFEGIFTEGNIDIAAKEYDFSNYNLYTEIDRMIDKEEFDIIDITIPTYLHAEVSIKALERGINVICEKPMALKVIDCEKMIEACRKNGKKLMIAQCLRFWPEYEFLKECVLDGRFGRTIGAYFFRGGMSPLWSYNNWMLKEEQCGGCILDQHVHDIDTINWLFGIPKKVSTSALNIIPGSGFDVLSTHYFYEDGKIITAEDDWTLNGDFGFEMLFRVNFEKGNLLYRDGVLKVNTNNGKGYIPELIKEHGYYREIKYFLEAVLNNTAIDSLSPESTMNTIKIAEAELRSAKAGGSLVEV